ncbi:DUF5985 family protein [Peristeroidobacter soli]|jgi:hypothetical protein|uniref:DUF5985 family protein n=1 Tax=Peristeroidobacter soli TaxID=2497877 RepID=UPI00101D5DAB|nr:DUF5985 family protein [Peristeroidobacter soli]
MIEGFLLGIIVTGSATAAAFFLRFWRQTRDTLFLAFAIAFLVEAGNRTAFLWLDNPHEGTPAVYLVRLVSYLLILTAIVMKNRA